MALVLIAVASFAATLAPVSGLGTIIELHKLPFFGGGDPVWVVPDPTTGSTGAPAGCTNLPAKNGFQSGRFYWNETAGVANCHFLWFFFEPNCGAGGARGVQVTNPPTDKSPWVTQDAIFSKTTYWKIQEGKSIGCSFEDDPCVAFPCSDPHAVCNSSMGWEWKDDAGKMWGQQTRNCSACVDGYGMGTDGKCTKAADLCANLACAAPATCQLDLEAGAKCVCPAGQVMDDSTNKCKVAGKGAWLNALNDVRVQSSPLIAGLQKLSLAKPDPIEWDANLAAVAQNWTVHLNSTECGKESVTLTKIPGGNYSESDVWVSWTKDESAAVQLWAPSPSDTSNPRTARITDRTTRLTGCGKAECGTGAFFTCLFWPKTY